PGLKEALSTDSPAEASLNLDELGYASLDVADAKPLSSETVGLGASEAATTNPELESSGVSNDAECEISYSDLLINSPEDDPLDQPTFTFTGDGTKAANGASKHPGRRLGQRGEISDDPDDPLTRRNAPTNPDLPGRVVQPAGNQKSERRPLRSRLLS